jgi:hypothetical protein
MDADRDPKDERDRQEWGKFFASCLVAIVVALLIWLTLVASCINSMTKVNGLQM